MSVTTAYRRPRRAAGAGAALAAFALLVGCAGGNGAADLGIERPEEEPVVEEEPEDPAPPAGQCDDALASYEPEGALPTPGELPGGSTMAQIRDRGSLVVGVSADTLQMSARNPLTGQIEGFDVDILREVSRAIFGDPDRLQFRVITAGQRIDVLTSGEVDLVARTFTITCDRWEEIAFSAEYLRSGQGLLVALGSEPSSIEAMEGRVCAPAGTTTLERLEELGSVEAVPAPTHGQCLALFQQGAVDGISGDDTILAGFAAQDPYASVLPETISEEPYGIGVAAQDIDMVRFVNGVLEQITADGTWASIYDRWLGAIGEAPTPPAPEYGRTP